MRPQVSSESAVLRERVFAKRHAGAERRLVQLSRFRTQIECRERRERIPSFEDQPPRRLMLPIGKNPATRSDPTAHEQGLRQLVEPPLVDYYIVVCERHDLTGGI